MAGTLLILLVPAIYRPIRALLGVLPVVRRAAGQVDTLRRESVVLLTRPVALASGVIDLARVALAAGALQLLLHAMNIERGWWLAVLVVAVAYVGGALSFLPGGIGANEASLIGVLIGFGVPVGQAAAVALLERLLLTGVPSVIGLLAYAAIHRRLHLGSLVASPRAALTASWRSSLRGGRLSRVRSRPATAASRPALRSCGAAPSPPRPRLRALPGRDVSGPPSSSPSRWGWARSWPSSWSATRLRWEGPSPDSTCC